ncbi:MAG: ABC transporter ATP-binding protein [Lachnospiraceae bacterium]|nr:ABC transporter ATP-binding protein [Lachnospiraceae bacterium]
MIRLIQVQKHYKDFTLNCSLTINPGRIVGLIGPNGSGKSTTFKAILGLIGVEGGAIEVLGKQVAPAPEVDTQKLFEARDREKLGVTFADSGFSGYLTITDVIKIQKAFYISFNEERFLSECKATKLPLKKPIRSFSNGMKAKLKVLAALSHNASLLLLDEPTAGLDVIARDEILTLLRKYMEEDENRAILISSHISGDLEELCDELYMIDNGNVIWHEDTDKLLSDYALLKLTEKQYEALDKTWLLRTRQEDCSIVCLTNEKEFYRENYPDVVIENGGIDDLIYFLVKGARVSGGAL